MGEFGPGRAGDRKKTPGLLQSEADSGILAGSTSYTGVSTSGKWAM
jgi:hypothetical protein